MNIKITAESTFDLTEEQLAHFGITKIPLTVQLGDETHTDGVDLDAEGIFSYVAKTGILPKTCAIPPVQFEDFFREQLDAGYDAVIHFCISSKLSSCYQNACLAAEEVGNVYVVDTLSLSTGMALLAIEAAEMAAKEDADAAAIAETCRTLAGRLNVSFVLGDLEYMRKGGRCSAVEMFGANLLKLRPVLEMKDGSLGVCNKLRGPLTKVTTAYIAERLAGKKILHNRVFFTSTCTEPTIPDLGKATLEATGLFDEILVSKAGCTVTSHCGKDTFGVLFIEE